MARVRCWASYAATPGSRCHREPKEVSYADFLDQVLTEDVAPKTAKHVSMRTQLARFPLVKGLESFDFRYQPSIDKKQIQTLSSSKHLPLRTEMEQEKRDALGRFPP